MDDLNSQKISKSLKEILKNPIMIEVLDKSKPVSDETIKEILSWWDFDLFSRKPGPAYSEDDTFVGTDLDLACFLYALHDRGACINLPEYKSMRKRGIKEGQILVSKENRHGVILGVSANKNTFSFSVRIKDMNVMTSNSVGDYRNFMLCGVDGEWYEGWKKINFLPNREENKFLNENKLWSGNEIMFKNFVHPNRWTGFYGHYYLITKVLISRLEEESKYMNNVISDMLESGIKYPIESFEELEKVERKYDKGKSIKVISFQAEIDIPNNSQFSDFKKTQENLVSLTRRRHYYVYKLSRRLRFPLRCTEFAFYKYGFKDDKERFPFWLQNIEWERNYKQSGKRVLWDRLVLVKDDIDENNTIAIRKRVYEKSEIVNPNYEE